MQSNINYKRRDNGPRITEQDLQFSNTQQEPHDDQFRLLNLLNEMSKKNIYLEEQFAILETKDPDKGKIRYLETNIQELLSRLNQLNDITEMQKQEKQMLYHTLQKVQGQLENDQDKIQQITEELVKVKQENLKLIQTNAELVQSNQELQQQTQMSNDLLKEIQDERWNAQLYRAKEISKEIDDQEKKMTSQQQWAQEVSQNSFHNIQQLQQEARNQSPNHANHVSKASLHNTLQQQARNLSPTPITQIRRSRDVSPAPIILKSRIRDVSPTLIIRNTNNVIREDNRQFSVENNYRQAVHQSPLLMKFVPEYKKGYQAHQAHTKSPIPTKSQIVYMKGSQFPTPHLNKSFVMVKQPQKMVKINLLQ